MNLSRNSMEEMLVHPDSRTKSQQNVQCQASEEASSSSSCQIEGTITNSSTTPTSPTSPRQQINIYRSNSEPPPIKKKSKKKKKGGYQAMMSTILSSQETDSQKQQKHLDTISNQIGHGAFSKIDKI